jgi:antitoxin VapB
MATAKLFKNGRSQAVRLPKEFRFRGTEVRIRREGDAVVLEPMKRKAWPQGFWETLPVLGDDFELPADPVPPPLRPSSARARTPR